MKKIWFLFIGIIIILAGILIFSQKFKASSFDTLNNYQGEMALYKSGSCGCCDVYSSYFKSKGNSNIKIIDLEENLSEIKKQYEIPSELESCHTTIIGNYFIEGHIPLEAVEKLLKEKPDIKGIAMPGMPSGSPGMPGPKSGNFVIYAVNNDGTSSEFMKI